MSSTIILQPGPTNGQDIWITNVFSYDSNYGVDDAWLKVGGWGDYYYSLIKFDLSSVNIAPNTVSSATLRLYSVDFGGGYAPTGMYIDKLHTSWTEDYGWYDYPLNYTYQTTVSSPSLGWTDTEVTALVADWLANPASNFGLQLRPVGNNHNLDYFVSSDASGAMAAYRPELVILYNSPVAIPEPASIALLAVGLAGLGVICRKRIKVSS